MSRSEKSSLQQIVDATCDQFEQDWQSGARPSIRKTVAEAPPHLREELFAELLGVELELRAVSGDLPVQAEYAASFPEQLALVESVFSDFQAWASSTQLVDESVRSHFFDSSQIGAVQDTQRQSAETVELGGLLETDTDVEQSPSGSRPESLPRQFGRYRLTKLLGRGGMGTVYLAHDERLDRSVALKLPDLDSRNLNEATLRFYREARAMATVQHPNLCPIFDVGEEEDQPFLTMAYLDGGSLGQKIQQGAVPPIRAAELIEKLAQALEVAHKAGVVHRDLKPSNVMLNAAGEPFITDFGLAARQRSVESELTHSGHVFGSPAYMAPEQVESRHGDIGPLTDVYALGVILYELLNGQRAFSGRPYEILTQIASGKTPPMNDGVPAGLQEICLKAMAPIASDRFASAESLAQALQEWLASPDAPMTNSVPKPHKRPAAKMWKPLLMVLALSGTIAFGIFLASKVRNRPIEESEPKIVAPSVYVQSKQILLQGLPSYLADLGQAVAIEGDTAVVGAPNWIGSIVQTGAVFVLQRARDENGAEKWSQTQVLMPGPETKSACTFGGSVAMDGDTLVVGARGRFDSGDGAAFVYKRLDGQWQFQQKLDPVMPGWFASKVAVGEGHVVVLNQNGLYTGILIVYEQDDEGQWKELQRLEDPNQANRFASAFAVHDEQILVSQVSTIDVVQGHYQLDVQVYELAGGSWQLGQTIPVRETFRRGEISLALDGDRLMVGVTSDPIGSATNCGVVDQFRLREGKWEYELRIAPPDPAENLTFGRRVAIDGDRLLVSATEEATLTRIIYPYKNADGNWNAEEPVRFSFDRNNIDDIAISGATAILGDPSHAERAGQVHFLPLQRAEQKTTWAPEAVSGSQYRLGSLLGNCLYVGDTGIFASERGGRVGEVRHAGVIRLFTPEGAAASILCPVSPEEGGGFGDPFVVDGDTLATKQDSSNTVELFQRQAGGFEHFQTLPVDQAEPNNRIGTSLAVSGSWLAIGSQPVPGTPTALQKYWVNLFHLEDDQWRLKQRLRPLGSSQRDRFGESILLDGNRLLVGAPGAYVTGDESGAVYVFELQGDLWKQQHRLSAADGRTRMQFGAKLSLSGNRLAVGCENNHTFGHKAGAVYIFEQSEGGEWTQRPEPLYAFDPREDAHFGCSVCLSGNRLLVGADNTSDRGNDSGSAYLYYYDGTDWQYHQKLVPTSKAPTLKQRFGRALTLHGDKLYVSAPSEYRVSGAIYVFEPEENFKP